MTTTSVPDLGAGTLPWNAGGSALTRKRFESLAQHGVYVKAIRSNLTGKIGPDGWEP